jgi:competence ComEA-like helix-hairpin-helix protein
VVNVNTASVFELMMVQGLNQELAANVVHYRERKGPFHTIEDLVKVG